MTCAWGVSVTAAAACAAVTEMNSDAVVGMSHDRERGAEQQERAQRLQQLVPCGLAALHLVDGGDQVRAGAVVHVAAQEVLGDRFVVEQEQRTPDSESMTAAARYQIEILGPLPE